MLFIFPLFYVGPQPIPSLARECTSKEQKEGGGAEGAAEADKLLVEELKGELSQTKLELETTLKAQHKHLKELDTLRLDMVLIHRTVVLSGCISLNTRINKLWQMLYVLMSINSVMTVVVNVFTKVFLLLSFYGSGFQSEGRPGVTSSNCMD